jgi:hypothetical protein
MGKEVLRRVQRSLVLLKIIVVLLHGNNVFLYLLYRAYYGQKNARKNLK